MPDTVEEWISEQPVLHPSPRSGRIFLKSCEATSTVNRFENGKIEPRSGRFRIERARFRIPPPRKPQLESLTSLTRRLCGCQQLHSGTMHGAKAVSRTSGGQEVGPAGCAGLKRQSVSKVAGRAIGCGDPAKQQARRVAFGFAASQTHGHTVDTMAQVPAGVSQW